MEYELNALSKNNNKKIFGPLEMDVFLILQPIEKNL